MWMKPDIFEYRLPSQLKKLRTELGYTQHKLALVSGVSRYAISSYEGGTKPNLDSLLMICEALNCTPDRLLDINEFHNLDKVTRSFVVMLKKISSEERETVMLLMKAFIHRKHEREIDSDSENVDKLFEKM